MPFPVSVPYVFGSLTGIVPASDLDANFTPIVNALNGINNGTYPLSSVSVTGGTWQGSPIGVSYGGTGVSSTPTNGQLLIGNGSGYTLSTISAGSGISVTNTAGGISIAVAGGASGTVTSVNASGGTTGLTFTGGPVTSSGTLTLSGTLAVANGGTGVTTSTGSGSNVLSTSPTLVTPALGTPTSVTLTNATGLPLSTGVTGTLASANGGTGFGTYTKGDIIYASATNTLSKLGVGTDGYVLKLTSGVPSWQAASSSLAVGTSAITGGTTGQILYDNAGVLGEKATTGSGNVVLDTGAVITLTNATGLPLTTGVTGILPSANGGTGLSAYAKGDIIYASAVNTLTKLTAGTDGYVLKLSGGVPTWQAVSGGSGTVTSVAVSGGTTGLTTSGGPITASGTITLAGTLAVANGGTNATTAAGARTSLGAASSGANTDITSIALTTGTVSTKPASLTDITNKNYVDSLVNGLNAQTPCLYATVAALPSCTYSAGVLTATANGTFSVDGVTVGATNARILVKNQASQLQNGVYVVSNVGDSASPFVLTRASDYNNSSQIAAGDSFYITGGTTLANTIWVEQTAAPVTIGTTAIVFTQFGGTAGSSPIKQPYANNGAVYATSTSTLTTGTLPTTGGGTGLTGFTAANNAIYSTSSSALTAGTLPIAAGGTGATTASAALTALGGASTGKAIAMALVFGG
jgi:hypothetical protein